MRRLRRLYSSAATVLEKLEKKPFGGADLRRMASELRAQGHYTAQTALVRDLQRVEPVGRPPSSHGVVILGGSNGITRSLALWLAFGEGVPVWCVHSDNQRMQIGAWHAAVAAEAAQKAGVRLSFTNRSATLADVRESVIADVVASDVRSVSLINGVAAGVPKRHASVGGCSVPDIACGYHPILQTPDLREITAVGMVEVPTATEQEQQRTMQLMGSALQTEWADALASAGLLKSGESALCFCDYDFPDWDEVYAQGPLADAKVDQRRALPGLADKHEVSAVSLKYPAMSTTALGVIPGGLLLYAGTAELLLKRQQLRSTLDLAGDTVAKLWPAAPGARDIRLDQAFQSVLPTHRDRVADLSRDLAAVGCVQELFPRLMASLGK
eukprot:TRINITY_DN44388_c0_g1_i1.p1 TRINITY_DN44388_c0_g1~~TRINITY_DN44388_c0_g1_i1.p1  ORF type:complete len:384 (+),score=118.71 TRINITY_DN44388_c0_g1_i1:61-1212(+)